MKINPRIYHISLLLYCIAIFILSSIPGDNFPDVEIEFSDKIVHLVVYAILFCLFFYSLKNQSKYVRLRELALEYSFAFTIFFGLTDEFHQYFVPYRSSEFYDWAADITGALTMYLIFKFAGRKRKIMIAVLLLIAAIAYSSIGDSTNNESKPKLKLESELSWLNLMPVVGDRRNVFCFNLKLRFSGNKLDTNYNITDFTVNLSNAKLRDKKFIKEISEVSDSGFLMTIYQDPEETYLGNDKIYPEEVSFAFNVKRKSKFIKSVKTHIIPIQKTY